jgi:hypothetical protein
MLNTVRTGKTSSREMEACLSPSRLFPDGLAVPLRSQKSL